MKNNYAIENGIEYLILCTFEDLGERLAHVDSEYSDWAEEKFYELLESSGKEFANETGIPVAILTEHGRAIGIERQEVEGWGPDEVEEIKKKGAWLKNEFINRFNDWAARA